MFAELTLRDGRRVLVAPAQVTSFTTPDSDDGLRHGAACRILMTTGPHVYVREAPDEVLQRLCVAAAAGPGYHLR